MSNRDKKKGIFTEHEIHTIILDLPIKLVGIVIRKDIWSIGAQRAMNKI